MLYRYPEPKRTTGEVVVGSKRYDSYTGEELPPLPYIYQGGGTAQPYGTAKAGSGTKTDGSTKTAAKKAAAQPQSGDAATLKREAVTAGYNQSRGLLNSGLATEKQAAEKANSDAMRQLYIAYMEGIKNMPQQAALWGAGGEIESLKTQKRLNYEDNRAKQNEKYMGVLGEIQQKYNSDLMELEEKYLKQLMNL